MRLQTVPAATLTGPPTLRPEAFAAWPDAVAYREAIQSPALSLGDSDLQAANVVLDRRGLPLAYSGRFAVVFRLRGPAGEDWAVRCFTHAAAGRGGADELRARYQASAEWAARQTPDYLVPFRYVEQGIRIEDGRGGAWLPVLAMKWAQGESLGRFVERRALAGDGAALLRLGDALTDLRTEMEADGVSHGDWQHDNILVSGDGQTVMLVDYDGLFVPGMAGLPAPGERGHANYQHPHRTMDEWGPSRDRFAHLVLDAGLRTLARDPSVFARFGGASGESVLFTRADFLDPDNSPVFAHARDLAHATGDVALGESVARLEAACRAGVPNNAAPAGRAPWWLQPEEKVTRVAAPKAEAVEQHTPSLQRDQQRDQQRAAAGVWGAILIATWFVATLGFSVSRNARPSAPTWFVEPSSGQTVRITPFPVVPGTGSWTPTAEVNVAPPRVDPFHSSRSLPTAPRTVTTASGFDYQDFVVGKGAQPRKGQLVTVRYSDTFLDGRPVRPGELPITYIFFLGSPNDTAGFTESVSTMRVGGRRVLTIFPDRGYGANGAPGGRIPPNAAFTLDVELLSVR